MMATALGAAAVRAEAGTDSGTVAKVLTVAARDLETGDPVPGVAITLSVRGAERMRATTDAEGNARFDYGLSGAAGQFFSVQARRDGLVPLAARWIRSRTEPEPPSRLLLQTEKATTIGGRVLDEAGKPLADAVVAVNVKKSYPESKQWVNLTYESIKTDGEGRWRFEGVPAKPDTIEVAAYHYLCLTDRPSFFLEPFKPLSALMDRSAVLKLRRGTIVEGTVLDPDGQPVAGADVFYGQGSGYINRIPAVKTDARGRFTFGIQPETISSVYARAPGFGPAVTGLRVGTNLLRPYLTLERAHTIRGRVVDQAGRPIPGAGIALSWSGPDATASSSRSGAIAKDLKTGADGRFEWKEAPGRGVFAEVYAAGRVGKREVALASDTDQEIVLTSPTVLKGEVVDRDTGKPIPEFRLVLGAVWRPGEPLIWQSRMGDDARKGVGTFEYTFREPAHQIIARVTADGYLAEDSPRVTPAGSPQTFTFRLRRAEPIQGTVINPDGSNAKGTMIYLVPGEEANSIDYLEITNGDVREGRRHGAIHASIGADGRFTLPPQKGKFVLVALADAGFAIMPGDEFRSDAAIRLKPWARVTGSVVLDGKPARELELSSFDPEPKKPVAGEPRIERGYFVNTDAEGRFALKRVLPGRVALSHWVTNGVERRRWPVVMATVDAESGKTYDLKIGQSGRRVAGRLVLPESTTWMIRKAEIVPAASKEPRPAPIGVRLHDDGRFGAVDLGPGDYTLRIALHEPPQGDACGWGRILGDYTCAFRVDEQPNNVPIDLGTLESARIENHPLNVGDAAPDFTVRTLDGKVLKLTNLRGKFVLLDFWATWCAPCVAEIPNLKKVHDEFRNDPRFVLVSLSLDESAGDAAYFVNAQKVPWTQAVVGAEAPVVSAYGATAIPATFLINPDGKIVGRDLRGETLSEAVAAALKQ
jgi:peroxiredoxin/protocatechuate 3,4-dioxygenase beta subunit